MQQTSARKIHRYLGPCLAERSQWQSKYSSNSTWQFSLCLVPCFVPRGSSGVCSYFLSDYTVSDDHRNLSFYPDSLLVIPERPLEVMPMGLDAPRCLTIKMFPKQTFLPPCPLFCHTVTPCTAMANTAFSPSHESSGAVFLPPAWPDKGCPPLLHLRLAFTQTLSFC